MTFWCSHICPPNLSIWCWNHQGLTSKFSKFDHSIIWTWCLKLVVKLLDLSIKSEFDHQISQIWVSDIAISLSSFRFGQKSSWIWLLILISVQITQKWLRWLKFDLKSSYIDPQINQFSVPNHLNLTFRLLRFHCETIWIWPLNHSDLMFGFLRVGSQIAQIWGSDDWYLAPKFVTFHFQESQISSTEFWV